MSEIRLILGDAAAPLLQVIRSELAHAAEAQAVLDRIAMTRLDGEVDERGNRAAMGPGDAVRTLAQVVHDARDASSTVAFRGRAWRKATARQWGTCEGCGAQAADGVPCGVQTPPCGDGILVRFEREGGAA
jgi:hypothetical protein